MVDGSLDGSGSFEDETFESEFETKAGTSGSDAGLEPENTAGDDDIAGDDDRD